MNAALAPHFAFKAFSAKPDTPNDFRILSAPRKVPPTNVHIISLARRCGPDALYLSVGGYSFLRSSRDFHNTNADGSSAHALWNERQRAAVGGGALVPHSRRKPRMSREHVDTAVAAVHCAANLSHSENAAEGKGETC